MKLSEDPTLAKKLLQLITMVRPDQTENFAKCGTWFMEQYTKQFGEHEIDELRDIIERKVAFHEGQIVIGTVFNWTKEGLRINKLKSVKSVSPTDYYDR